MQKLSAKNAPQKQQARNIGYAVARAPPPPPRNQKDVHQDAFEDINDFWDNISVRESEVGGTSEASSSRVATCSQSTANKAEGSSTHETSDPQCLLQLLKDLRHDMHQRWMNSAYSWMKLSSLSLACARQITIYCWKLSETQKIRRK
ncbi:hypothetical protein M404DRAFT_561588 [Pisolithus tinctorius Marx 270]|uniref:Uncharacterized protein n=1 Tax=Pisolithus tinctorius Marx 270 TaxID=870435 RepID=A0A0C3PGP5_PISTI|nr:hypothetical protein M404DRAFT_561588 [Pisolithus tinctorius Marx 270]